MSVAEIAEAFAADLNTDPEGWRVDLAVADRTFARDEPTDPFGGDKR